jgi:DMSO reductase anchor subunit
MDILTVFLSWQFLIFCLAVFGVTFVIRTIVEYIIKQVVKTSSLWNDMVLPILPIVIGTIMGLFLKAFPYPEGLTNKDSRIIFGLVAGLLSTLLYRMIKTLIIKKILDAYPQASPVVAKVEAVLPDPVVTTTVVPAIDNSDLAEQVKEPITKE